MQDKDVNHEIHAPALEEFVGMIAGMKTYEEFGQDQPEIGDWIETLGGLIVLARGILGSDKPTQRTTIQV